MYRYLGNFRQQLWFDSPNVCASFLGITVLLTIGLFIWRVRNTHYKKRISSWILISPLILLQFILIAQTYSRGGWLALSCVLLCLAFLRRDKITWGIFVLFVVCLVLTPDGSHRIHSATITQDGSIKHRILLWQGALGLIAKYPISGVPAEKLGEYYTAWYQPLWLNEGYATFINDYLTIAGKYGLGGLIGYLWLLLMVLYCTTKLLFKLDNSLLLYTVAATVCYLLSSMFSTIFVHANVYWLFVLLIIVLIIVAIWGITTEQLKLTCHELIFVSFIPFAIAFMVFLGGLLVNHCLPYCFFDNRDLVIARPQSMNKAEILLISSSDKYDHISTIRKVIRPLLLKNYTVFSFHIKPGLDGLKELDDSLIKIKNINKGTSPLFIIAENDVANVVVCNKWNFTPTGIIAVNLPIIWPWKELSPIEHLPRLKCPLLLLKDLGQSYTQEERMQLYSMKLNICIAEFDRDKNFIKLLDKFILKCLQENQIVFSQNLLELEMTDSVTSLH